MSNQSINLQYRDQPPLAAEIDKLRAENEALRAALEFYVLICGNTCAVVDRKSAGYAYDMARAAIAKATE